MPSFDTKLDPNLDSVGNAVDTTGKEIGTRFDFKNDIIAIHWIAWNQHLLQLLGCGFASYRHSFSFR